MIDEAKKNRKENKKIVVNIDPQAYNENDPDLLILKNEGINLNKEKDDYNFEKKGEMDSKRLNSSKSKKFMINEGENFIILNGNQTETIKIKDVTIDSQNLLHNYQDNFFISKKTTKRSERNNFLSRPRSKILHLNNSIDPINKVT